MNSNTPLDNPHQTALEYISHLLEGLNDPNLYQNVKESDAAGVSALVTNVAMLCSTGPFIRVENLGPQPSGQGSNFSPMDPTK